MLTVTNGHIVLSVTNGAYHNYYAQRGFRPVTDVDDHKNGVDITLPPITPQPKTGGTEASTEPSGPSITPEPPETVQSSENPTNEVDLSEIPLSEMNYTQLVTYAEQLGLDCEGMQKGKVLAAIREHLGKTK